MKLHVRVAQESQGDYRAFSPALPGCVCRGRTLHEALERFLDESRCYLAALTNFVPERIVGEVVEV